MVLLEGLYIRTVRRWRSSGAPETISAGIGARSSFKGFGAGTCVVLWSASGMDFSPVKGVCVIFAGPGGFEELCLMNTDWIGLI